MTTERAAGLDKVREARRIATNAVQKRLLDEALAALAAPVAASYEREIGRATENGELPRAVAKTVDLPPLAAPVAVDDVLRNVATYHDVASIHDRLRVALATGDSEGPGLGVEEVRKAYRDASRTATTTDSLLRDMTANLNVILAAARLRDDSLPEPVPPEEWRLTGADMLRESEPVPPE